MNIENMNDLEILLSSFDSLNPCLSQPHEEEGETLNPIYQELFLDIIHKTSTG